MSEDCKRKQVWTKVQDETFEDMRIHLQCEAKRAARWRPDLGGHGSSYQEERDRTLVIGKAFLLLVDRLLGLWKWRRLLDPELILVVRICRRLLQLRCLKDQLDVLLFARNALNSDLWELFRITQGNQYSRKWSGK